LTGFTATAIYLPQAAMRSSWSDDHPLLLSLSMDKVIADGRPILAAANHLALDLAGTINGLAWVRVLGVLGIAGVAILLTRLLQSEGWPPVIASLTALTAILLPPFHSFAGWAAVFAFPWTLCLGLLAGRLLLTATTERSIAAGVGSTSILTIALLAYPPSAMACWIPIAVRILSGRVGTGLGLRMVAHTGLTVALSGFLSLAFARLSMAAMDIAPHQRFTFVNSVDEAIDKVRWLTTRPFVLAMRPFQISSPDGRDAALSAAPIMVLLLAGALLILPGRLRQRLGLILLVSTCAMGTVLSHIVSIENQTEFRYLAALLVLSWLATVTAGRELLRRLTERRGQLQGPMVAATALIILAAVGSVAAIRNIQQVFVGPSKVKEAYLRSELSTYDPSRHAEIVIVVPEEPWPNRPNLGIYSTRTDLAHPWSIAPNVLLLLDEEHTDSPHPTITVSPRRPSASQPSVLVVDLRPLRNRL